MADLVGREPEVLGAKGHVIEDGLGKELPLGMLHYIADPAVEASTVLAGGRVDAVHDNLAGVGGLECRDESDEGGFSRPGLSHDGDGRALVDAKGDVP